MTATWIVAICIVALSIILKIFSMRDKSNVKKNSKKNESKDSETSKKDEHTSDEHASSHDSGHSPEHGHSGPDMYSRVVNILGIILLTIVIFIVASSYINHRKEVKKTTNNTEVYEQKWVAVDNRTIPLSCEMGGTYILAYYDRFTFKNSTQPYCVFNKNNDRVCGGIGEDVSTKMGTTNANKELRFMSSSGQKGQITLVIWRLQTFKK